MERPATPPMRRFVALKGRYSPSPIVSVTVSREGVIERFRSAGRNDVAEWLERRSSKALSSIVNDVRVRMLRNEPVDEAIDRSVRAAFQRAQDDKARRRARKIDPRRACAKWVFGNELDNAGDAWVTQTLIWYGQSKPLVQIDDASLKARWPELAADWDALAFNAQQRAKHPTLFHFAPSPEIGA